MKKLLPIIILSSFMISCAMTHPGRVAEKTITSGENLNLKVSAWVVGKYSDEAHQFIDFTFENTDTNWTRIKSIDFKYGEDNAVKYNIIAGEDLVTWAEAFELKRRNTDHNRDLFISSILLVGATAASSNSDNTRAAGLGALMIGMGAGVATGVEKDYLRLNASPRFPRNHLHNSNFTIPAKLFIRKWVLINVPGEKWANYAYVTLNTVDGKSETYKIKIQS